MHQFIGFLNTQYPAFVCKLRRSLYIILNKLLGYGFSVSLVV